MSHVETGWALYPAHLKISYTYIVLTVYGFYMVPRTTIQYKLSGKCEVTLRNVPCDILTISLTASHFFFLSTNKIRILMKKLSNKRIKFCDTTHHVILQISHVGYTCEWSISEDQRKKLLLSCTRLQMCMHPAANTKDVCLFAALQFSASTSHSPSDDKKT